MQTMVASSISKELLRFADGLDRIKQHLGEDALTEEEAAKFRSELADVCAEHIVAVLRPCEPEGVRLLMDLGVETLVARRLASESSLDDIKGWIAYANRCPGLDNPAGLVVARLRDGVPAPRVARPALDPSRYITGKYADYIQH